MSARPTLSILVHGESKVGKSWFGASAPAPRLILDSEGRAKYAPSVAPKVYWDPRQGPPPASDGTWDTCICAVPDFETMNLAFQWLRSGQHHFLSVVVDSLMEVQKRCIDVIAGASQMEIQNWGELLRELEKLVRSYRDLVLIESNAADVVVFIVGCKDDDGVKRPLLQGALQDTVPYYMDSIGYMYKEAVMNGSEVVYQRSMLVDSQPGFVAGDGTDRLPGPIIHNPNLTELFQFLRVNGQPQPQEAVAT